MSDLDSYTLGHRDNLQKLENEGWTHFDDLIFKLAAGALAISVTFLGVLETPPQAMQAMFAAWVFLVGALTLLLLSVVTSQMAHRRAIREIDKTKAFVPGGGGRWDMATVVFNIFAGFFCFLGLLSVVMFALLNIGGAVSPQQTTIEKGRPLPQAPAPPRPAPAATPPAAPATPAPAKAEERGRPMPQAPPVARPTTAQPPTPSPSPSTPDRKGTGKG
jgi:hypothetical protein